MLFTSFDFLIFLALYLFFTFTFKHQWKIISILFSFFFYAYWSIPLSFLLLFVSSQAWYAGKIVSVECKNQKKYTIISITISLFILGVFKYLNFFVNDILPQDIAQSAQFDFISTIVLPVGVSFYTFQAISYVLDVKSKKIIPAKYLDVILYITFFPQLVAGPIVRASTFLPQIERGIKFSYKKIKTGILLILWGYLLKLGLADNAGFIVDIVYSNIPIASPSTVLATVFTYSFQIYGDFAGYSLIAIGVAKLVGFNFQANFNIPYIARSFSDFWRRWHISLSTFLRDYLYIALGGNRKSQIKTYRNLILTMTLGGLWHGASINFVVWGILHGLALSIERLLGPLKWFKAFKDNFTYSIFIFICVTLFWIPFRLGTWSETNSVIMAIMSPEALDLSNIQYKFIFAKVMFIIAFVFIIDFIFTKRRTIKLLNNDLLTGFTLIFLLSFIFSFGAFDAENFIYFQF